MILVLFFLSAFGGFLSGFLGLGGAIVMIPLMLTVPPLFNVGELAMKAVAGLSMVQVLFASVSGIIIHKKNNFVHFQTLFLIGIPMGMFSLLGSYFSKYIDDRLVLMVFGGMVIIAFFMLLVKSKQKKSEDINSVNPNKLLSVVVGSVVGTLSGVVGAGGGFVLIPVMTNILKIPLKVTIGTSLGIVLIGAILGVIGKLISFQVDYILVIPIVLGSLAFGQIGAKISKKTSAEKLRYILIFVVIISFVQVVIKLM